MTMGKYSDLNYIFNRIKSRLDKIVYPAIRWDSEFCLEVELIPLMHVVNIKGHIIEELPE